MAVDGGALSDGKAARLRAEAESRRVSGDEVSSLAVAATERSQFDGLTEANAAATAPQSAAPAVSVEEEEDDHDEPP